MEKRAAGRLLCALVSGNKTAAAGLEKLSPADWENLADWAQRLKVTGLFYREIKSPGFPAEHVPLQVRNRLRQAYRDQATLNASLFFDAMNVIKSLTENHLPVIALKGLALAKDIYGDIALRPMSDMDLLLKEEDLVMAGRKLLALGYEPESNDWEKRSKIYHHLPPFKNKNGTIVELHWNIVTPDSPVTVDLDGLWARSCLIRLEQIEVRALAAEDLFLHLCLHGCFHLQTVSDLIPFCDIAGLLKKSTDKLDWQAIAARSARWGANPCVYLMLLLVRELLGTAPPEQLLADILPGDYQAVFREEALEQIFDEKPTAALIKRRIGKLAKIKQNKGLKGKVIALLKEIFPEKAYLALIYPVAVSSPKIYLYYFLRLGRLLVYFAKIFIRLFRRDRSLTKAIDQEQRLSVLSDWMFPKPHPARDCGSEVKIKIKTKNS